LIAVLAKKFFTIAFDIKKPRGSQKTFGSITINTFDGSFYEVHITSRNAHAKVQRQIFPLSVGPCALSGFMKAALSFPQ